MRRLRTRPKKLFFGECSLVQAVFRAVSYWSSAYQTIGLTQIFRKSVAESHYQGNESAGKGVFVATASSTDP